MKKEKIDLKDVPLSFACRILEILFLAQKSGKRCSLNDIIKYFEKTEGYTKRALYFLKDFDILDINDGIVEIKKPYLKKLDGSLEKSKLVLKESIINFKPFVEYYAFINKGKDREESAKLVKLIYNIKQKPKRIVKIFENWSKFIGIDEIHNEKPVVVDDVENINLNLNNIFLIQTFLKNQFGDYFRDISKNVIDDLVEALRDYKIDPPKSVNDAGRALEDFLRIDFGTNIDLTKCSGIIQIANLLCNRHILTAKHNNVLTGLGSIRSMGDAHGVDKKLYERWMITEETALIYILLVIKTMISLLEYKKNKNLIF